MTIEFERYSEEMLLLPALGLSYSGSIVEIQFGWLWWGVIVSYEKPWYWLP